MNVKLETHVINWEDYNMRIASGNAIANNYYHNYWDLTGQAILSSILRTEIRKLTTQGLYPTSK